MKRKIVVRMRGGLGNQLFIIAFSYFVASKMNDEYEIVLDDREYDYYKIRRFEILDLIKDDDIRLYDSKKDSSLFYEISRKLFHIFQRFIFNYAALSNILKKCGLYYSRRSGENVSDVKKTCVYLYGYFQDARVVDQVKDKINKQMNICDTGYLFNLNYKYIAVSIRCGQDYIDNGWPICSAEYFNKGIQYLVNNKYVNENIRILVFADEMEQVRSWDFGRTVEFMDRYSAVEQIQIMMNCDDFVIANSSFAWWGAYLGCKSHSVVIMPKVWYSLDEKIEDTLLLFDHCVVL